MAWPHSGPHRAVQLVEALDGLPLASSVTAVRTLGHSWGIVMRQAVWLVLGVAAAFGASRVPWRLGSCT